MLTAYVRNMVTRNGWATVTLPWTEGEHILIVSDSDSLKVAQEQNPGLVDYLLEEVEILDPRERDFTALRNLHLIKKIIGGRICKRVPQHSQTV
jgi:hypothetical protein